MKIADFPMMTGSIRNGSSIQINFDRDVTNEHHNYLVNIIILAQHLAEFATHQDSADFG